jgi:hypothetical protein
MVEGVAIASLSVKEITAAEVRKEIVVETFKNWDVKEIKCGASSLSELGDAIESGDTNDSFNQKAESVLADPQTIEGLKDAIEQYDCINSSLEGKLHPEAGVPYVRKTVENFEGATLSVIVPEFNESFAVQLPEDLLQSSDKAQFDYSNETLESAYDNGEIDASKFTDRQLEQIKNGDKPEEFTWHHSEVKGRMELIDSKTHNAAAHTGGKAIWGGGKNAR